MECITVRGASFGNISTTLNLLESTTALQGSHCRPGISENAGGMKSLKSNPSEPLPTSTTR